MNLEAFVVIGLFALLLGALLFVLSRLWVKRQLRDHSEAHVKIRLTMAGMICIPVLVIVLIGGLLMQYLAPESLLGQFVKTHSGRFFYAATVAIVFWLLEIVLKARGIRFIEKLNKGGVRRSNR